MPLNRDRPCGTGVADLRFILASAGRPL